jgi:acetate kinase
MGTRCGDLDVGVLFHIADKENMSAEHLQDLVNKRSGLLGVSGISSDMRDIEKAASAGNLRARLALDMFAYRVKKYIGAYTAAMGGVNVIVFTGGIGENDVESRRRILEGMEFLGIDLDNEKNQTVRGEEDLITHPGSRVKVLVIPTNEELVIAEDTFHLVAK